MVSMQIYLIAILILLGATCLQVFLSRRKDKILGLVLPVLTFLRSLNIVFSLWKSDIAPMEVLALFLFSNIPTMIFIIIYILGRKKIKRNKEIEKMNIQDLK